MSDVREELMDVLRGFDCFDYPEAADAILERFEVTVKPEPPVIGDKILGVLVAASHNESPDYAKAGRSLRERLADRGLEIVWKEETE